MSLSNWAKTEINDWFVSRTSASQGWHVALHTANPSTVANFGTEIQGAGSQYERQPINSWTTPGVTISVNHDITFLGLPKSRITHIAIWKDRVGGEMIMFTTLSPEVHIKKGGGLHIPAGSITVSYA